jgi:catechol 2,3-dioxygenase
MSYTVPPKTSVGHIHLKVSSIEQALGFYRDLLGFEVTMFYGDSAVFLSAGGYHHHIGLNTWHSKDASPAPQRSAGLYHVAFLYPSRRDLAQIVRRILENGYPLSGAADHGVSEAVYLNDPDGNGVELYWDRPVEDWPKQTDGSIEMYTHRLDLQLLINSELK